MKTKMQLLFSFLLITAFVLSACGGAPATEAPVEPTAAPTAAPTEAPTEAPT